MLVKANAAGARPCGVDTKCSTAGVMNYAWHPCTPKQYKMVKAVENEQQAAVREEQQEQQRRCDLKVWRQKGAASRTNIVASSSGTAASNREIISQYT